ncbi:hypothetical protein NST07_03755 [Paenibacillus sp. FSL L8-0340]|uniref:hypothetical protein n=1 Tax=Paenibacillus sp. FSL L8-0340 TaxID=2954685 RepID=UPI003158A603
MEIRKKIGVLGVGRMGKCIVQALPRCEKLILVDKIVTPQLQTIAAEKAALLSNDIKQLDEVNILIIAIPYSEFSYIKEDLLMISNNKQIINIATLLRRQELESVFQFNEILNIKIIGESTEIENGNKALLVVQDINLSDEQKFNIEWLFKDFGDIIYSENDFVSEINSFVAEQTIKMILHVEKKLSSEDIEPKIVEKAVKNVMKGTCATYPWAADDDFINQIKARLPK